MHQTAVQQLLDIAPRAAVLAAVRESSKLPAPGGLDLPKTGTKTSVSGWRGAPVPSFGGC